jgi:hypothetical protein
MGAVTREARDTTNDLGLTNYHIVCETIAGLYADVSNTPVEELIGV